MANQFDTQPVNVLQALMAGEQTYKDMRQEERQGTLARLMQGNNDRDFQFRQQEATRTQGNADRAFKLQQQTANDAARGFEYREIDDGNGGKQMIRINKATGQAGRLQIGGGPAPGSGGNPFSDGGKFSESEGKAAGFADRMLQSEGMLRPFAPDGGIGPAAPGVESAGTDLKQYAIANTWGLPAVAKNAMHSKEYQSYDQAKRDFINAQLRRESGAVIADSEFENAHKQYFPVPGDPPELLEQKRRNRQVAIESMGREGGRSYRPKLGFDAAGNVQRRAAPQQQQTQGQSGGISEGATATNPQTGQKIMFRGGQWVPAQ